MQDTIDYDLQCFILRLSSENEDFSQQLQWFVEPLRMTSSAQDSHRPVANVRCRLVKDFDAMAGFEEDEPSTVRFEIFGEVSALQQPGRIRYFVEGAFSLTLSEAGEAKIGAVELDVCPTCSSNQISLCSVLAFDHSTRAGKACLIHSSCLDTPDGDRFLVMAESGVGKTTTSLKLARAGMPLSGDDTTLVWVQDGRCVGFSIPRPARVSKDALSRVDGLAAIVKSDAWDAEDEQELTRDQLSSFVTLTGFEAKPIAAVVHLTRSRTGPAAVTDLVPAEAMSVALAENITMARSGMTNHQMERFNLYAHLFGDSRCLQLELGDDDATFVADLNKAISD